MMRNKSGIICGVLELALIAGAIFLPVPALARKKHHKKHQKAKRVVINRVWPLPPQKPRYKLLQIINGEMDVVPKKKVGLVSRLVADTNGPRYIHFGRPRGLAGDSHGRLYVTDTYLSSIFVIDPRKRTFKIFAAGNPDVKFRQPLAITVDSQDRVWVADAAARAVYCFSPDQKLLLQFGNDPGMGKKKIPTLQRPAGVAVDMKRDRVYVSDAQLDEIFVYDTHGHYLTKFGKRGTQPGELFSPGELLLDHDGNLYVADTMNARVDVFDPELEYVKSIGSRCDHPGCFARPIGLAFDNENHLYVTDSWFNNVQIFGHDPRVKDPNKLSVLMFLGTGGHLPGQFMGPGGVYVNKLNQVFVADQINGRVQVIQYLGGNGK